MRGPFESRTVTYEIELPNYDYERGWYNFSSENEPKLSTMLRISQDERNLAKLLKHQYNWLQDIKIEDFKLNLPWIGKWIYSSLTCINTPVEPNMHSAVREIAKQCIRLRNLFTEDMTDDVVPLNLIIAVVAKNFNQLDLA